MHGDDAMLKTTTLVTPPAYDYKGKLNIKGLDAGTYTLTEIKPPDGYNKIPDKIIVITHWEAGTDMMGQLGEYTVKVDAGVATHGMQTVIVVQNFSGNELPTTGGIGTTIFYIIGAALAGVLVAAIVIRRKKNILDAE